MVAKQLSIKSILTSIYKIYLVMPAPPQFPDVRTYPIIVNIMHDHHLTSGVTCNDEAKEIR